jgi:hypothetical protein
MNKSNMNKKGLAAIMLMTIAGIVIISLILGLFIFSEKYKWIIIGIGTLLGMFILLANTFKMEGEISKGKLSIILILLVISIMFIFYGSVVQSFLGVSEFRQDDGKGYWLISGVADNIGDSAQFLTKLPPTATLTDGTKITPQSAIKISISKGTAECEYGLIQKSASIYTGLFSKKTVTYYEVNSPERVINAVFSDDRGNSHNIDGTISQNIIFNDNDGKGQAVITTLKSTQGKQDCPASNNLIVLKASENTFLTTDYAIEYLDKITFTNFLSKYSTWLGQFGGSELQKTALNQDTFVTAFSNGQLTIVNNKIIGTGRDIGDVIFTITADRDYFNSIIITPAKPAIPIIENIANPSGISDGKSSNIKVTIKNNGNPGNINIKFASSYFSFSPSSSNILLNDRITFTTTVIASDTAKADAPITVTTCGIGQTISGTCDSETINIDIVKADSPDAPIDTCGDGACQAFETVTSCAKDCNTGINQTLVCDKWYQDYGVTTTYKYNFLGFKFGAQPTPVCLVSSWIYFMVFGGIILVLGIVLIVIWKPSKKIKSKLK